MKKLMRRLSRVADSSVNYSLLRSATVAPSSSRRRRGGNGNAPPFRVPEGHLPVYVGDEMERFVVSAELLNHPIFVSLLDKSAQEYGYAQKGALRIPCHVLVFERVLETLRLGHGGDAADLQDLFRSLSISDDDGDINFCQN